MQGKRKQNRAARGHTGTASASSIEYLERRSLLAAVISSMFDFNTPQQQNVFQFDEDVSASFTEEDLTVYNLTSNSSLLATNYQLALSGTNAYALTFPGYSYQAVPDGNYETIIEKEGIDGLSDDHVLPFWFYNADFNRDRTVNLDDFTILAAGFGMPRTFTGGDASYSGTVNLDDFTILAAKFGMSLNPPPTDPNTLTLSGLADLVTLSPFIRIDWAAPVAPPAGQPPILGYRVWRSTDGVNFGSPIAQIDDPNVTSFDDTTVTEGVKYWYRVRAFSSAGNSETTPKREMITPLKAPTNLALEQLDSTQFKLTWTNNSTAATQFHVFRSSSPMLSNPEEVGIVLISGPSEFTHTIPNGEGPQQWFYYVQAANLPANSAPSNIVTTRPQYPEELTISFNQSPLRLDLDWSNSPESGVTYNVYRSTSLEFESALTTQVATGLTISQFADTTVSGSTRYFYRVTAVSAGVESFPSEPRDQVTGVNSQPIDLQATASSEFSMNVAWTDVSSNETGYIVDVYQGSSLIQTIPLEADAEGVYVDGLLDGTTHTFEVRATFASGPEASGPTVSASTLGEDQGVGLVIAINGHFQRANTIDKPSTPNVDERTGTKRIVDNIRAFNLPGGKKYRVIEAAEDFYRRSSGSWINWDGSGSLFDIVNPILNSPLNTIRDVAIIGYSHGAGVIDNFINRLYIERQPLAIWSVKFVGTTDAIQRGPVDYWVPAFAETSAIPRDPQYHINYYNVAPWNPVPFGQTSNPVKGKPMNGADENIALNSTHVGIQYDDSTVINRFTNQVRNRISL